MYWTDHTRDTIERASMDGTSRSIIVSTGLFPTGLTLDYNTQTLYWIDDYYNRIEKSNADGSGHSILTSSGISGPFDIDFYQNTLYWTDSSSLRVSSLTVSPLGSVTTVRQSITSYTPYGIHVVAVDRQPQGMGA